jgi:hydrogenase maturation protein HypF
LLAALLNPELMIADGANLFHGTLIAGLADWISERADTTGRSQVALSGGCMMNAVLADGLAASLRARGLVPWLPRAVPANDGGLSLGQAALARAALSAGANQPEMRI